MSPIELIARGLKNQSWKDVADGYSALTGVHVRVPETNANDLVSLLKRAISQLEGVETAPEPAKEVVAAPKAKRGRAPKKTAASKNPPDNKDGGMTFISANEVSLSKEEEEWNQRIATEQKERPARANKSARFRCGSCKEDLPWAAVAVTRIGENNKGESLCGKCRKMRR